MADPQDPFTNGQGIPGYILPYEEVPEEINPGALAVFGEAIACGHCDFASQVVETPLGIFPVVTFQFHDAMMRPLKPISVLLDTEHMQGLKENLVRAMNDAIRKAKARGAV